MAKRKSPNDDLSLALVNKKPKSDVTLTSSREKTVIPEGVDRTSNLMAPIMLMEGHQGEIFTVAFHPEGQYLASAGFDRQIFLWNVYGECENISLMQGHSGAIMELHFSTDGNSVYTASTDQALGIWDIELGVRVKRLKVLHKFLFLSGRNINYDTAEQVISGGIDNDLKVWDLRKNSTLYEMKGHTDSVTGVSLSPDGSYLLSNSMDNTLRIWDVRAFAPQERCVKMGTVLIPESCCHTSFVNSCQSARRGPTQLVSGSDDCSIKVWDPRKKGQCVTLNNIYQVLAVTFNDTAEQVISGGIDNDLKVWDLRKNSTLYEMKGHTDSVTGVSLSPDGSYLLSNSMDNTLRIWDVRAFAPQERCVKIFTGHQHNFEKNLLRCCWSTDGSKISAGSADRFVYIWDTTSRRILYKLPGHNGSVNDVDFHPKEPIILSGSSDKLLYMGEIEP